MEQEKKQLELNALRKRCHIFYDYHYKKYGQLEIYKTAKVTIDQEFEKQNLRALREANKDLNNWLREMPVNDALELGEILKKELKEDITIIEKKRLSRIEKVIKEGKITTEDEYYLLLSRVDEIYDDDSKKEEVEALNKLLVGYHKQV